MYLKYRPVTIADLEECSRCIRDAFTYDAAARRDLLSLWRELVTAKAANAMVMEDVRAVPGERIVWFCFKVFVTDVFATHMKTDAPPFVGRYVVELARAGQSPLLNFQQLRKANSPGQCGVNLLVLNSGAPPRVFAQGLWNLIAGKVVEFTPLCAGGYRLNELLIEVYDDFGTTWVEGTGMRLRNAYEAYFARENTSPLRHANGAVVVPRLYGISKAEADAAYGTAFSAIFHRQTPRYRFSHAEQELLQWALFGESDAELAGSLSISQASVRKRWVGIYAEIARVTPELFGDVRDTEEGRGAEKKRHILGYLRHHLEELRPACDTEG